MGQAPLVSSESIHDASYFRAGDELDSYRLDLQKKQKKALAKDEAKK